MFQQVYVRWWDLLTPLLEPIPFRLLVWLASADVVTNNSRPDCDGSQVVNISIGV
jgi:hypothetical protein